MKKSEKEGKESVLSSVIKTQDRLVRTKEREREGERVFFFFFFLLAGGEEGERPLNASIFFLPVYSTVANFKKDRTFVGKHDQGSLDHSFFSKEKAKKCIVYLPLLLYHTYKILGFGFCCLSLSLSLFFVSNNLRSENGVVRKEWC